MKQAIKAAEQRYNEKLMSRCLNALHNNLETEGKLKMVSQVRSVTAAVKAFESLKKNLLMARAKHALKLKHMEYRASKLKQKVFCSFAKVLTRRLLGIEVQHRSQTRKLATMFSKWEDLLSLKLWRKDACNLFNVILTRRALKMWRQKTVLDFKTE